MGGAIISESGGGIIPLQGGGIIPELGGGFLRNQQVDIAIPTFGYQNHVSIDREHGLIRR